MKKTRLLLMALVIMASASVSMAQTLITSTQASTKVILPKSDRVIGLVIRPELGACVDLSYSGEFIFGLNCTIGYQINPYIAVGGGYNYDSSTQSYYDYSWGYNKHRFSSWFVNFRAYFSDTYISPYFDLKVGTLKIGSNFEPIGMGSGMVGIQWKRFDLGTSIKYCYYYNDSWILALHFAYNIQFGKK